jgi:hypothetical protein
MREAIMRNTITGAAVAAALALTGLSAQASCSDPRSAPQASAYHRITLPAMQQPLGEFAGQQREDAQRFVGTWLVSYTIEGSPFADAIIQWHGDGTEFENVNLPILGGNICLGEWVPIDDSRVRRKHMGWMYSNGALVGYFTEVEIDTISPNGLSYHGTNDQKFFDVHGNPQGEVTGTSSATRLFH